MKTDAKTTLIASLIGSAAGTAAWFYGVADRVWPQHPQVAVFLLTILSTVLAMVMWPTNRPTSTTPRKNV